MTEAESRLPYVWLEELLEDPDILKPPSPIVPRLVWSNRLTLLAAREKTGKSTLSGAAAAAVSSGRNFLGDDVLPGNVLIVALEEHPQEFVARLVRFGADPKRVAIVQATSSNLVSDIRAAAEAVEPKLIVWDTLGAFANLVSGKTLESGDAQAWTRVMMEIVDISREFGASLLLHHANKSDGKYRDSTAIGASVDAIITMSGSGDGPRTLKTEARWNVPEISLKLEESGFTILQTEDEIRRQITEFVALHPKCSARDIAAGVSGVRFEDLNRVKAKMLSKGEILNVGKGQKHEYMARG